MASGRCSNPMCTCDPCGCEDCTCGSARLGELETRMMEVLWAADGEISAREASAHFPEHAYTTIATVLDRLVAKELATKRIVNRVGRYGAVGSPEARAAAVMHEALSTSADPVRALRAFAASLSAEQRAALRAAVAPRRSTTRPRA